MHLDTSLYTHTHTPVNHPQHRPLHNSNIYWLNCFVLDNISHGDILKARLQNNFHFPVNLQEGWKGGDLGQPGMQHNVDRSVML